MYLQVTCFTCQVSWYWLVLMACFYFGFVRHLKPGPEVIKLFSCSNQLSMKLILFINLKILTFFFFKTSFMLNSAEHAQLRWAWKQFELLAFLFLWPSDIFMLSWVENGKCFITSGPDLCYSYILQLGRAMRNHVFGHLRAAHAVWSGL